MKSRKSMSSKFYGGFICTDTKNDKKFKEELTCRFKIGMRNLTNFDMSTRKSQNFAL